VAFLIVPWTAQAATTEDLVIAPDCHFTPSQVNDFFGGTYGTIQVWDYYHLTSASNHLIYVRRESGDVGSDFDLNNPPAGEAVPFGDPKPYFIGASLTGLQPLKIQETTQNSQRNNPDSVTNGIYSPDIYFDVDNNVYVCGSTSEPDLSTHIESVVPHATTTATTTEVSFTAYINPVDYVEGMVIRASFFNPTIGATSANVIDACNVFGAGRCSYDFPITASTTVASRTIIRFNYGGPT